jgi:PhzF family phenazine biosynthesis protein
MNSLPLSVVDAFTDQAFSGNPAGVCLLDRARPDEWMRLVAAELKHSETAFLLPEADGYRLRWFTPVKEVSLCGHATLASAHVLAEMGKLAPGSEVRFYTLSGLLTARLVDGWIELNFPAREISPAEPPAGLLDALGIRAARFTGGNGQRCLIELDSENELRALTPDFPAVKATGVRGVTVTARSADPRFDFVSRYFAPIVGIDEDPVTGSAHCLLGPYWAGRLGKTSFRAYQASARGGTLLVRVEGERVALSGHAVTVFSGQLAVD